MDFGLAGRVALVAAASKGIGKACAVSLAAEGCRVSICARSAEDLVRARDEVAAAGGESMAVIADVSSAEDLQRWVDETRSRFGAADILVTNTGGPPVARFEALEEAQWMAGIDSTLLSAIRMSRLVIPGMREKGWGRIIHLTSLVAKQPADELTISSTLRAGLSGLTKTMSNQLGEAGITVNAVLMGHVLTGRQEHLAEVRSAARSITREQYFEEQAREIPVRRLGRAEEIGDVVAFLASERASYLTGVSLQVDGGLIRSTF